MEELRRVPVDVKEASTRRQDGGTLVDFVEERTKPSVFFPHAILFGVVRPL